MMKFHVSTAIRTAVSTHVAEILRDVGPEVLLFSIILRLLPDFLLPRESTSGKLPSLLTCTLGNWVRIRHD